MELRTFTFRRVVTFFPALFLIVFLVFLFAGPDLPSTEDFLSQFISHLQVAMHGNFVYTGSAFYGGTVTKAIELYFPTTLEFGIFTTMLTVIITISKGISMGGHFNSISNLSSRTISPAFYVVPVFGIAIIWSIMRHLIPNRLSNVTIQSALNIGSVILFLSAIEYINVGNVFGISKLMSRMGNLIAQGSRLIFLHGGLSMRWVIITTTLLVILLCVGVNIMGVALGDMLDQGRRRMKNGE